MADGVGCLNAGSDVVFDFYCEICKDDGRLLEAHGFCVNCSEYLCDVCYSGHRTTRPTRHHVLQDRASMPKDMPLSPDKPSKDIMTTCNEHSDEPVKYYCATHRALGCSACFIEGHRGCYGIKSIVELSENILESREYSDTIANLRAMKSKSRGIEANSRDSKIVSQKCCDDVVSSIRKLTEDARSRLHEFEKSTVTLAEQMTSANEERLESAVEECCVISEKIELLFSEFENLHSSKRACQLFIAMTKAQAEVEEMQQRIAKLEKETMVKPFRFEPNTDVTTGLLRNPDVLGKIATDAHTTSAPASPSTVTMKHIADINLGHSCYITGSAVISKDRLIIVDHSKNEQLKLVDTNTYKIVATLNIQTSPWDVARICEHQAAVTLPETNKIVLVKVTETLTSEREIILRGGRCRGVAYSRGRLLVTYRPGNGNPRLEILDMYGNVIKKIETNGDGGLLFWWPEYVCVSMDGENVYVSDFHEGQVTNVSIDGDVKAVYEDNKLKGPEKGTMS